MLFIGLGLALVGASALLMMHVTQTIPRSLGAHRQEQPELFRRYWKAYLIMFSVGVALAGLGMLRT